MSLHLLRSSAMVRATVIFFGLLLSGTASGQRTIGLSLNSAYKTKDTDVLLFGAGVSATQPVGQRTHLFVSAVGYVAHRDEGTFVKGPRWLPVGDTTSGNHRFSNRTNFFILSFGLQHYTHRRHVDQGFCWLANVGIGADRVRYIDEVAPVYSSSNYTIDETDLYPFLAVGGGFGYTFPLQGADITCSLIDNWSFPFERRDPRPRSVVEHHSAGLSVSYRWGL